MKKTFTLTLLVLLLSVIVGLDAINVYQVTSRSQADLVVYVIDTYSYVPRIDAVVYQVGMNESPARSNILEWQFVYDKSIADKFIYFAKSPEGVDLILRFCDAVEQTKSNDRARWLLK